MPDTLESTPHGSWQRIKDVVEIASKVATVLLTIIAFWATQQYNRRQEEKQRNDQRQQTELNQLQTIIGLFDPLASTDLKKHNLAIITVKELTTNVPLAIKLCRAAASEEECAAPVSTFGLGSLLAASSDTSRGSLEVRQTAAAALDRKQAGQDRSSGRQAVASAAPTAARDSAKVAAGPTRQGWVFLGTYADSAWVSKYLEFGDRAVPRELAGKSFQVRNRTGALNVRANL